MQLRRLLTALALTTAVAAPPIAAHADGTTSRGPSIAWYVDHYIDLRVSWEGAQACTTDGVTTECFATEADMDSHVQPVTPRTVVANLIGVVPLLSCASSLSLYDGTSWNTPVLRITSRQVYVNLSLYGFDNVTSSYSVGACSATFFDGAGGGGAVYPGNTAAFASSSSMVAGWDNRVSSVYIA